jgi:hypothetical protein
LQHHVCKAAERDLPEPLKLKELESQPISSLDGLVVVAVRDELGAGVGSILADPQHVPTQPAAARQLAAILGTLSKATQRRGKLAVVKPMTNQRTSR